MPAPPPTLFGSSTSRLVEKWWVSHPKFTGQVETDALQIVTSTPPVWRTFVGQPFSNLLGWLKRLGPGLKYERL
jgi:hypothetical protein